VGKPRTDYVIDLSSSPHISFHAAYIPHFHIFRRMYSFLLSSLVMIFPPEHIPDLYGSMSGRKGNELGKLMGKMGCEERESVNGACFGVERSRSRPHLTIAPIPSCTRNVDSVIRRNENEDEMREIHPIGMSNCVFDRLVPPEGQKGWRCWQSRHGRSWTGSRSAGSGCDGLGPESSGVKQPSALSTPGG